MAAKNAVNKSAFIRSQSSTLPAAEVVAKAKASGLKFDPAYVYKIRKMATRKSGTARKTSASSRSRGSTRMAIARKATAVPRPIRTRSSAETLLRAVAAEIGLGRAMEILAAERAMVRAVIGD